MDTPPNTPPNTSPDTPPTEPMEPGALRRGLRILGALRDAAALRAAELAALTGIPRPTVYRLLEILEAEGFVAREADGKSFTLAAAVDNPDDRWGAFVRQMEPVMRRIAQRTGNAVFLVRQKDNDLLCLHREIGTYPIQILSLPVGGRQPLGVGAAGVALLSTMGARQVTALLKANTEAYLNYGNLHVSTVRRLVENCRERGYAVVGNYSLKGILAVGVPMKASGGLGQAAMSVTAPLDRMSIPRQREAVAIMQAEIKAAGH